VEGAPAKAFYLWKELYSFPPWGEIKRGVNIDKEGMVYVTIIVKYYIAIGTQRTTEG
jgi:hypothetical protein